MILSGSLVYLFVILRRALKAVDPARCGYRERVNPPTPPVASASWWLRLGQAVLFVGLLGLADPRRAPRRGQPVLAASTAVLAVFGVGFVLHGRLGGHGRAVWVGVLFAGVTWLILHAAAGSSGWRSRCGCSPGPCCRCCGHCSSRGDARRHRHRPRLDRRDAPGAVLGPTIGALVAVELARGVLRFEHEASEHRRLVGEVLRAQDATAAARARGRRPGRAGAARPRHPRHARTGFQFGRAARPGCPA